MTKTIVAIIAMILVALYQLYTAPYKMLDCVETPFCRGTVIEVYEDSEAYLLINVKCVDREWKYAYTKFDAVIGRCNGDN